METAKSVAISAQARMCWPASAASVADAGGAAASLDGDHEGSLRWARGLGLVEDRQWVPQPGPHQSLVSYVPALLVQVRDEVYPSLRR